ncbi:hypothetical protein [Mesobacillus maritimus]|uniref:Uncharacterized protein n=1 Tax=Mesobacillus maritimus TaxID=1643336 RepID=A0ABS7K4E9_9BACI|nr:hypothetical protein [Mesobacillus maritimus]MBY0097119.1 hypothetical protein [Mesobacillus maritimus]
MLMERILSRENLLTTLKRVERNKGSHCVDGMLNRYLTGWCKAQNVRVETVEENQN